MTRPEHREHRVRIGRRPLVAFQRTVDTVRLETARLVLEMALSEIPNLKMRDALRRTLVDHLDKDARR